jgi:hypothetical protein
VTIGGFKIPDQDFGEIIDEDGEVFMNGYFDGILGLAFPNMSPGETEPVFDKLMGLDIMEHDLYAFYYSLDPEESSSISFGSIDETKYVGDFNWVPVIDGMEYYWLIQIDAITLGKHDIGL